MIPGAAGKARFRRVSVWLGLGLLALVAGVGLLHSPGSASAGELFAASPVPSAGPLATASALDPGWSGGGLGIDLFDLAWKCELVLALLFVTLRVLARVQGTGQPRRGALNVLESRTLAPKASLHLVAVGERRLVVGLTPGGMIALAELDAAELPAAESEPEPEAANPMTRPRVAPVDRFADRLAQMMRAGSGRGSSTGRGGAGTDRAEVGR